MPEEAELIWDDGSKHPEPTLDNPAPSLTPVRSFTCLHFRGLSGRAVAFSVHSAYTFLSPSSCRERLPHGLQAASLCLVSLDLQPR